MCFEIFHVFEASGFCPSEAAALMAPLICLLVQSTQSHLSVALNIFLCFTVLNH